MYFILRSKSEKCDVLVRDDCLVDSVDEVSKSTSIDTLYGLLITGIKFM